MKQLRKVLVILVILLSVLGMMSQVKAFNVYKDQVNPYLKEFLGGVHFCATEFSGDSLR